MRYLSMFAPGLISALVLGQSGYLAQQKPEGHETLKGPPIYSPGPIDSFQPNHDIIQSDDTGKGAVLCAWGIYQAVKAVGDQCFKDKDSGFRKELDKSLIHIDAFIIENSSSIKTKAALNARRDKGLAQLHLGTSICVGDGSRMYNIMRDQGAAALHAQVANLLSIPREPVMNPCL